MDPYRIPQTLIVAPEQSFEQLAGALGRLGFARDAAAAPAQPPLLPGEPELAGWSWHGDKPVITYSFNPVVRLRVLDVSTLPPQLRAAVAHSVPRVEPSQVPAWLRSDEARERLLAIFIARESERFELMGAVQQAAQDREVPVARAAKEAAEALQRTLDARLTTLAQLRALSGVAAELVARMIDPSVLSSLRPSAEDCAKLFDAELARELAPLVAQAWQRPPRIHPGADYPQLEVVAAPAGLLRSHNELSEQFPLGYREIAGWMTPNRVWVSWRQHGSSGRGVHYDGLALVDDHWIWIPKVFRLAAPLLQARLERASAPQRTLH